MADNKIGFFAISTFNTDYVLTKKENYQKALDVLKNAGYKIIE
ncbi:MAG: ACT domain-containing protein [Lachnospiraceae bacterium]|nr:ACT domain-containing protein [Lachnospiraceae bacterium]